MAGAGAHHEKISHSDAAAPLRDSADPVASHFNGIPHRGPPGPFGYHRRVIWLMPAEAFFGPLAGFPATLSGRFAEVSAWHSGKSRRRRKDRWPSLGRARHGIVREGAC